MDNMEEGTNVDKHKKLIESEVVVVASAYKEEWEKRKAAIKDIDWKPGHVITVSAVVICKNEQENIFGCIKGIQRMGLDEIVVIDTGSIDQTVKIVEEIALDDSNVKLYHYSWSDDFAAVRNYGINLTLCDWVFFIDADEKFANNPGRNINELIHYYSSVCGDEIGICPVIISASFDRLYNNPRIFNKKCNYQYYGNVHEMLRKDDKSYAPIPFICLNIQLEHTGYDKNIIQFKLRRNLELLDLNIEKERNNPLWYCYKLRDGRDILDIEQKKCLYETVYEICRKHLDDSFYSYCFDWASVIIIQNVILAGEIEQAQIYYDKLIQFGKGSREDVFYLQALIELGRIDMRLSQLEEQCHLMRNGSGVSTSIINTQGYHIDEMIMRVLEKEHKMAEYLKYCDFLFSVGYLTEKQ